MGWLFLAVLVAAAFETVGVASILPFMAVVTDPTVLARSATAQAVLGTFGVTDPRLAIVAIGVAVIAVLLVSNLAAAASHWLQQTYLARVQQELSSELFAGFLAQPYVFHVERDAASLSTSVFNHTNAVLSHAVSPLVLAVTRSIVVVSMLALLLFLDPVIALGAFLTLGFAYAGIYQLLRGQQIRIGKVMAESGEDRYRLVMEGLGGVKELIVLGRERATLDRFYAASGLFFRSASRNTVNSMLPRYLLETVAFGGIVLVTVLLVLRGGSVQAVLPALTLYAFVGYRLMPAMQQIFASAIALRFSAAALDALEADLALVRRAPTDARQGAAAVTWGPGPGRVTLQNVSFTYRGADTPALHEVSLEIHAGESVGLVGRTGSGKTTLADLLLGLHKPSRGTISVGGVLLGNENITAWRQHVGYVPQSVFLANASIAENIAFGLGSNDLDYEAVLRAARLAQAEEFIEALPDGYGTMVGERGIRLSGGQRQRLGIARALYHNPSVLVFDEATSALDGMTEEAVMDALRNLSGTRTVLLIAHRIRTVEACDRIFVLDQGRLLAEGRYAELRERSPAFRRLLGRVLNAGAEHQSAGHPVI